MINVLVVDDDPVVRELLTNTLTGYGLTVKTAASAVSAHRALRKGDIDVVLLDLVLPDADGIDVCRDIRLGSAIPIIMLTAISDEVTKVLGLEMGADDFMVKPAQPRELLARIRALLRRSVVVESAYATVEADSVAYPSADPTFTQVPNLPTPSQKVHAWRVDWKTRSLIDPSKQAQPLSAAEARVLAALLKNPGKVLSREHLIELTRTSEFKMLERSVDLMISRLRAKLRQPPDGNQFIRTVRGEGYRFTGGSIVQLDPVTGS